MPGFVPTSRGYAGAVFVRRRAASEDWERVDSNHRRLSRQIYSLLPLSTRAHSQGLSSLRHYPSSVKCAAERPEGD